MENEMGIVNEQWSSQTRHLGSSRRFLREEADLMLSGLTDKRGE
jgi:hypothetical protein